jgi:signal transduction histidine kinase
MLRARLLASYLFLLTLTLVVIVLTFLIFAGTRQEPPISAYQRLAAFIQNLNVNELTRQFFEANPQRLRASGVELLTNFAALQNVRVVVVNFDTNVVLFDSENTYQRPEQLYLTVDRYNLPPQVARQLQQRLPPGARLIFGAFSDPNQTEWLFSGFVNFSQQFNSSYGILVADTPSIRSLQDALNDFGTAIATPLLQSAFIGFVVAFILATLISRTLAKPLQTFAAAAIAIANGKYEQTVPVTGPHEIRAVAEAFNRMASEVHTTQQAQRDFMANVSHDLKTPLTSIQGYSQAIMDGTAKDPTRAAAIIYDEAGRLSRMVSDLTELARLQAGALAMQKAQIDIGQITEAVVHRLHVVAEQKGITLNTDIQKIFPLIADGDRMAQVITNLISNAIKYTPPGGSVWVAVKPERGGVEIIVRDTGIGIPKSELSRIFERFYQVDKARGPERGTGLGLAISREIVHAHGGKIAVQSTGEEQGAAFIVWLPIAAF